MPNASDDNNAVPNIDRIVTQYGDTLLRMCFLYLKDVHTAQDAVQDTFVKVYQKYDQFEGKSSEKTWIMRIAINICKTHLRSPWSKRVDACHCVNPAQAGARTPQEATERMVLR